MSIVHVQGREEMKTCPYDKSHRVTALKFPNHIIKCRKNHEGKLDTCPFNATHLVPRGDLYAHMSNCPDRLTVERDIVFHQTNSEYRQQGNTQVPTYDNDVFEPTENWDLEANDSYTAGYDPSFAMSQVQFRNPNTLSGMKRAEKKVFRKEQFASSTPAKRTESVVEDLRRVTTQLKELRLPKQPPKMLSEQNTKPFVTGIGRGRRIAADIYRNEVVNANTTELVNTYVNFARGRGMKCRRSDERCESGASYATGRTSVASGVSVLTDQSTYYDTQVDQVGSRLRQIHLEGVHVDDDKVDLVGSRLKGIHLDTVHRVNKVDQVGSRLENIHLDDDDDNN